MATSCALSADQLTRPFIESTQNVFSMMLGCSVELSEQVTNTRSHCLDLSGIIGFSGSLRGTIVISMGQNVAFSIAEVLLGTRPESIDADVRDMVGELANLIGGNAKERFNNNDVSLGLPTVISGSGYEIDLDPSAELHKLSFATQWGPFSVEIALRQVH